MSARGTATSYDEVVADVARDLRVDEGELRETFSRWLDTTHDTRRELIASGRMTELDDARCYAVYRLTKSAGAFRGLMKTVERRGETIRRLRAGE